MIIQKAGTHSAKSTQSLTRFVYRIRWAALIHFASSNRIKHLKTLENGAPKFPADVHVHRKLSAESARKRAENQDARGVVEEESFVEARDGYQIPIRIHSPDVDTGPGPLIVFNHGGGFCVGTLDTDIIHPRSFVRRLGAVVVAVDYRLAPEHPFPTGVLDSWDVVQWVRIFMLLNGRRTLTNVRLPKMLNVSKRTPLKASLLGASLLAEGLVQR